MHENKTKNEKEMKQLKIIIEQYSKKAQENEKQIRELNVQVKIITDKLNKNEKDL